MSPNHPERARASSPWRHLRHLRAAVALAVLALAALAFLDFGRLLPARVAAPVARLQLVPALLRLPARAAVVTVLALALLTLLLGRVYCSTLCPLGTLQDVLIRLGAGLRRRPRFRSVRPPAAVQLGVAALAGALAAAGWLLPLDLLEPWSAFGRVLAALGRPLVAFSVNGVSGLLAELHVYAVAPVAAPAVPAAALVVALCSLAGLAALTRARGRLFCNLLCPAGALLRLVAGRAALRVSIDGARCNGCGRCALACKAGCIDAAGRAVDHAACVACFDCLAECPRDGVRFGRPLPASQGSRPGADDAGGEPPGDGALPAARGGLLRRDLLRVAGLAAAGGVLRPAAALAAPPDPRDARRPITPPGAGDLRRFTSRCTACQLCVATCPTQVLRPALLEYGPAGLLQPHLVYAAGACAYDCRRCGEVCPTGAIAPLSLEAKKRVQVGRARFVKDDCVVAVKQKACGACAEHCPTKAVKMVPYQGRLRIPEVDEALCVGCGSCEHPCPTEPRKAIYVEARSPHGTAKAPEQAPLETPPAGADFPF